MSDWTPNYGQLSAPAPAWAAKRPIRIALLGDFGAGAAAGRLDTGDELTRRKPRAVEFDSLEDWLGQQNITLNLPVGTDGAPVEIPLADLDSFHPDTLFRELDLFKKLNDLRKRLNNTASFDKAAAEVAKFAGSTQKASRAGRGARARGASPSAGARLDDFARLTGRASAPDSGGGIDTLLRNVIGPFVVPAAKPEKAGLLNTLDAAIADGMRAVLHQADFQATESLWRGVDFLLRRLETGPMLQVHLIDISAEEFAADLSASDDLTDSGLYRLLVSKPAEAKDGGYTYVAGLYQFEATPPHTELLGRMAKVAAAAGATFFTAMAVDELSNPRVPPHPLVVDAFAALRGLPESKRLALLGPRFLMRHPYGKRSDPISSFAFEEFTMADGLGGLLWGHPALLALTVLAGQNGAPNVNDLPFHHFVDADGDSTALPCTERFISSMVATELGRYGIKALMAHKGEPLVQLTGPDTVAGVFTPPAAGAAKPGARMGVELAVRSKLAEPVQRPGRKSAANAEPEASEEAAADAEAQADTTTTALASDSPDDSSDLDALLAGLNSDDAAPAPEPAASDSDDLDALLASLNDDSPAIESAAADSESDVDAELEALLKSLS
ncbi:type VI secretion system contractile sheath domain-containing protein [Roseateles sp. P5_E11]